MALVVLLLTEGVQLPKTSSSPAPKTTPTTVPLTAPHPSEKAAPSTSGSGYRSLCLLGVLFGCPSNGSTPSPRGPPPPLGAGDPVSSWTNITPPLGKPNPSQRAFPSMTYYPTGHEVLLFGGHAASGPTEFQDTWAFAGDTWTQLISNTSCTPSTCPSPREDAGIAYYPPLNAVLLFGGEVSYFVVQHVYNDTWLFYGGEWHNVTASVGPAPSPRFGEAMTWDSLDNEAVLFGGATQGGTALDDTWAFTGTWTNITTSAVGPSSTYPSARAAASISDSPTGYLLMFGGVAGTTVLTDANDGGGTYCGPSIVAFWFHLGQWLPQEQPPCLVRPASANLPAAGPVLPPGYAPPCGREYAAVGWSPKNQRFVIYGGFGYLVQTSFPIDCSGGPGPLNDTWVYENPPGNGYDYKFAGDSGDPSNRTDMGYANDFSDGYFLIFGGLTSGPWENETWRFYEVVHAALTGPSSIDTNASHLSFNIPFQVTAFGGTGTLDYAWSYVTLHNSNALVDGGTTNCDELTNISGVPSYGPLPYDGVAQVACVPTPTSYNIDRVTVHVWDVNNVTDQASASWTFTVNPPEYLEVHSQYVGYFYSGINLTNKFAVSANLAGGAASAVSATLAGVPVQFAPRSGSPDWWDASVDMGNVPYGDQSLQVSATFPGNWVLNATYAVNVVEVPDWLESVITFPEVTQSIATQGPGPYNQSFSITESFSWSLDQALGFNITLPFVKGNVSLIPAITVSITATSSGNLTLAGSLSLTPPSIDLGIVSIQISIVFSMKGYFTLGLVGGEVTGVNWVSATASITLTGKFSVNVPIYGFDILGIKVGFNLEVDVSPSVTLGLLLAPTTPGFDEFIQGIAVKIQQFVGSFMLPLSVAVSFSIGIASVGIGGSVSIALNFATNTGLYIPAGWINGTIFANASFLWWSTQWNIVSGTIYSWTSPPPAGPAALAMAGMKSVGAAYNNGTGARWVLHARYYTGTGYDQDVWASSESQGFAVSDIYPSTEVSGAAASNGAYLFYTDDNTSQPVQTGLGISGLSLNATSNELVHVSTPSEPGYVLANPRATTLPNGDLYVLWDAVPSAETDLSSPANLTTIELQGAQFDPGNGTWGPTRTFTSWGLAQSYLADTTGGSDVALALVSSSYLVGTTSAERLVEFNLTTGAPVANSSVTGISTLVSVRGSLGEAVVKGVDGNFSTVALASGVESAIPNVSPVGGNLVSAKLVTGSTSTAVLLYRGGNHSLLALYDLASSTTVATHLLGGDAFDADALANGSTYFVFLRTHAGVDSWTETAGTFENLSSLSEPGLLSFSLVQFGTGILVVSLVRPGSSPSSSVDLELAEVGASLVPVVAPPSSSSSHHPPPPPGTTQRNVTNVVSADYTLYLEITGAAVVVLLGVVVVVSRRRPPSTGVTSAAPNSSEAPLAAPEGIESSSPPSPGAGGG